MHSQSTSTVPVRLLLQILLLFLLVPLLLSCGGGSEGTGLSSEVSFSGSARTVSGQPVSSLQIIARTESGTTEETSTDGEGTYDFSILWRGGEEILLSFSGDGISSEFLFADLPEDLIEGIVDWEQQGSEMVPTDVELITAE